MSVPGQTQERMRGCISHRRIYVSVTDQLGSNPGDAESVGQ